MVKLYFPLFNQNNGEAFHDLAAICGNIIITLVVLWFISCIIYVIVKLFGRFMSSRRSKFL